MSASAATRIGRAYFCEVSPRGCGGRRPRSSNPVHRRRLGAPGRGSPGERSARIGSSSRARPHRRHTAPGSGHIPTDRLEQPACKGNARGRRASLSSSMSTAPVGIFDSGVGGLSVLREIHAALPSESIDYVADSANAPWGDKPPEFVRDRGLKIARFLIDQGAKAIVIGSNTGTAGSAEALRETLTIPVIGIEPGIKPAVAATKSRVVGAIVPVAVGDSERLASLVDRFGGDVKVITQPVPGLVE